MSLTPKMVAVRLAAVAGAAVLGLTLPAVAAIAPAPADATRSAKIPFDAARVTSADGQSFEIIWSAPTETGGVAVYAGSALTASGALTAPRPVGHALSSGRLVVANLPTAVRWYFELRPAHGAPLVVADRSLHFKSAPNFRDIGGYRTTDGRWVRMGMTYRSDQLDRINDEDFARLSALAPSVIIDLRTAAERRSGADRLPPGSQSRIDDVLGDTPLITASLRQAQGPDETAAMMADVNRTFVSSTNARAAYGRLFATDLQTSASAVFHCTAGKDRSGWASAVLLTLLGVPREAVFADYLASNHFLEDKNKAAFAGMSPAASQKMEPVMTVRTVYLQAAFDEIDRKYGSFSNYLQSGLGVSPQAVDALRARYLMGLASGDLEERSTRR